MNYQATLAVLGLAATAALAGCGGETRTPEKYAADTRVMLEAKSGVIKDCYDSELRRDKVMAGTVIIHFTITPALGTINALAVDPRTTNQVLGQCVVKALEGAKLEPPDDAAGAATFTWEFTVGATPAPGSISAPTPG